MRRALSRHQMTSASRRRASGSVTSHQLSVVSFQGWLRAIEKETEEDEEGQAGAAPEQAIAANLYLSNHERVQRAQAAQVVFKNQRRPP